MALLPIHSVHANNLMYLSTCKYRIEGTKHVQHTQKYCYIFRKIYFFFFKYHQTNDQLLYKNSKFDPNIALNGLK